MCLIEQTIKIGNFQHRDRPRFHVEHSGTKIELSEAFELISIFYKSLQLILHEVVVLYTNTICLFGQQEINQI